MTENNYHQTIQEWREIRNKTIRQENGWLALAGLYWLKLGKNQFGSDTKAEIQLPSRVPANVGYFEYNGRSVTLHVNHGQNVKVNDKVTEFMILQPDVSETPSIINFQDIQLMVIQRGNRMGVRIWDNKREARLNFPDRTWYDVDENFRVAAIFTPYERQKMAYFPDLTGEKAEFPVEGYLTFKLNGTEYQLDINKEDDGTHFVRFWDLTSKDETYPTGRYLIADVEEDGTIHIDFNKAYSPPCAFTDFATCVFAPAQNHLDVKITAGETYQRKN